MCYTKLLSCSLILQFKDAVQMLRDNGIEMGDEDDLRFAFIAFAGEL